MKEFNQSIWIVPALVSWAAIIRYHRLGDLKQQKFVVSYFWWPRCWQGCASFQGSGEHLLCLFQRLVASGVPPFPGFITPAPALSVWPKSLCLSLIGPTWVIMDEIISTSLITSANIFFPNKATFRSSGWTYLWEGSHTTHFSIIFLTFCSGCQHLV